MLRGLLVLLIAGLSAIPLARADGSALENLLAPFNANGLDPASAWALSLLQEDEPARAIRVLERTLDEIDEARDSFSTALIVPYILLSEAHVQRGEFRKADEALTRAQHITHRRWGSINEYQLPLVNRRADIQLARGESFEAGELGAMAIRVSAERFGVVSEPYVIAAMQHGRRLREQGRYKEALTALRSAAREIEKASSDTDPLLVPLLRARGEAFLGGPLAGRSLWMTRRALEIMDQNPEVFPIAERVAARVEYGDLQMVFSYERAAVREYERAWRLADEHGETKLREALERPTLVRYRTFFPEERAVSVSEHMAFEFDITPDGRARNVSLVSSTASDIVNYYAPRIARQELRFRPAITNGTAQAVDDHVQPLVLGLRETGVPRVGQLFTPPEPVGASTNVSF